MRIRHVAIGAAVAVGALVLLGCSAGGDDDAERLAEEAVFTIAERIAPISSAPRDADYLAVQAVAAAPSGPNVPRAEILVEALAWEGNSREGDGASTDLRISVHIEASNASTIGGTSYEEGHAVRCWRLTMLNGIAVPRPIECPDGPAPDAPTPGPLPVLPDDVEALIVSAMTGASADDVDERVRTAFPEDYVVIRTAFSGGELVAAVGVPEELECAVGVLHADGSVEVLRGWKRELLLPGEIGCDPDLYLNPVTTH